jgi:hypothetical protein
VSIAIIGNDNILASLAYAIRQGRFIRQVSVGGEEMKDHSRSGELKDMRKKICILLAIVLLVSIFTVTVNASSWTLSVGTKNYTVGIDDEFTFSPQSDGWYTFLDKAAVGDLGWMYIYEQDGETPVGGFSNSSSGNEGSYCYIKVFLKTGKTYKLKNEPDTYLVGKQSTFSVSYTAERNISLDSITSFTSDADNTTLLTFRPITTKFYSISLTGKCMVQSVRSDAIEGSDYKYISEAKDFLGNAGETYYIQINNLDSGVNTVKISSMSIADMSLSDSFQQAVTYTQIDNGYSVYNENCRISYTGATTNVVSFTPSVSGNYSFDTTLKGDGNEIYTPSEEAINGSLMALRIFDSNYVALPEQASYKYKSDDEKNHTFSTDSLSTNLTAGQKYYIEMYTWQFGQSGILTFSVNTTASKPILVLTETDPYNGETDVSGGDLKLIFSKNVRMNWSAGEIYIKDYDSDGIIDTIDSKRFYALGGTIEGNTVTIPNLISVINMLYHPYVYIPTGLIVASDSSGLVFSGLTDKAQFQFQFGSHQFRLGANSNSFAHYTNTNEDKRSGFVGVDDYSMDEKYESRLLENENAGVIDGVKSQISKKWLGSCYGIACTMALTYAKKLNPLRINERNQLSYFNFSYPYQDKTFLNTIQYYQISQFLSHKSDVGSVDFENYYIGLINRAVNKENINSFLKTLVSYSQTHDCGVLKYSYDISFLKTDGHAILVLGCSRDSDNNYLIKLFDENSRFKERPDEFLYMTISPDYTKFSFKDANGDSIDEQHFRSMSLISPDDIYSIPPYSDDKDSLSMLQGEAEYATIVVAADKNFYLTNNNGESLSCKDGIFSGNMQVHDIYTTLNDTPDEQNVCYYDFEVNPSTSYTLTGENVDMAIYTGNNYLAVNTKGTPTVNFLMGKGITLSGSSYSFTSFVSTDNNIGRIAKNENGLISLSAKTSGEVTVTKANYGLYVKPESNLTDVQSKAYEGNSVRLLGINSTLSGDTVINAQQTSTISNAYQIKISQTCHGVVKVDNTTATSGKTIVVDITPEYGYELGKLIITDGSGNTVKITKAKSGYTFTMPESDVQVTASFRSLLEMPFIDVEKGAWYYNPIEYCFNIGIFKGTSDNTFSPNLQITREQTWILLSRISGDSICNETEAREWAIKNHITDGNNPKSPITREQLATMLYRFAQLISYASLSNSGTASNYIDFVDISKYAIEPMCWAVDNGIFKGYNNSLRPKDYATRAQAAAVFMQLYIRGIIDIK